ncbi:hypothetical protein BST95_00485 [Halioglobus japonicus]|uniref:HPr kinase/phosphorylase n=1 Tax=Halioglobus japonicus TaxID=930805 RepID=A0AAP8MBL3_9GAMM|nr:hypothetical protein [Halioglobus japonicus]AQA16923.1 hypothetical protein BST95_00485 [Halioglobus japonicus]PLW84807.1 hypothetical protein C0029_17560 [Halioglobus japonicus]GHD21518.1 hypothetical protein GCM10007052_32390 [Halioglobus japonicus]
MELATWGEQHVDLSFAGFQFRIEGLTQEQCAPIRQRYGLNPDQASIQRCQATICAAEKAFPRHSIERYNDPQTGYRQLIEEVADSKLSVEGVDYRGEISLTPDAGGVLYTNTATEAATSVVFENFLRILSALMALELRGLLLHSAGVVINDKAYLCLGRSGAGKSTLAAKALEAGATILSDDGNLLLPSPEGGYEVAPVPFAGDLGQTACQGNRPYPVAGLFWLCQSDELAVETLSPGVAFGRLMACAPTVNSLHSRGPQLEDVLLEILAILPFHQLKSRAGDDFTTIYSRILEANHT